MQSTDTPDRITDTGAVRIGNGDKLHPAAVHSRYGIEIHCSCPGTQQGAAYRKARFFSGLTANCRSSGVPA